MDVSAISNSRGARQTISWFVFGLMASVTFVGILSELAPSGVLPQMAVGLGAGEIEIGFLVGVYAPASAVCAIPLVSATLAVNRKYLLLALLIGFAASNIVVAISSSYAVIVACRVLGGVCAGVMWPMIAAHGTRLVAEEMHGKAITIIMSGNTRSNSPFAVMRNSSVMIVLLLAFLAVSAHYGVSTDITLLVEIIGFAGGAGLALLIFGVGSVISVFVSAKYIDGHLRPLIVVMLAVGGIYFAQRVLPLGPGVRPAGDDVSDRRQQTGRRRRERARTCDRSCLRRGYSDCGAIGKRDCSEFGGDWWHGSIIPTLQGGKEKAERRPVLHTHAHRERPVPQTGETGAVLRASRPGRRWPCC